MDFAKRLLDYGFHAPTTYFPLLVPECLLIEPTETESKEVLDAFVTAMSQIQQEAEQEPERVTQRTAYTCRCAGWMTCARRGSWISHGSRQRSSRPIQAERDDAAYCAPSAREPQRPRGAAARRRRFARNLPWRCIVIPLGLWLGTVASSGRCWSARCC